MFEFLEIFRWAYFQVGLLSGFYGMSSGSLGSFPRRFLKCLVQLASRLDCEPPFKRTVVLERFPEIYEIVFQAA